MWQVQSPARLRPQRQSPTVRLKNPETLHPLPIHWHGNRSSRPCFLPETLPRVEGAPGPPAGAWASFSSWAGHEVIKVKQSSLTLPLFYCLPNSLLRHTPNILKGHNTD